MPHSKQAKKRLRQDQKRRLVNRAMKSSMKTHIKRVLRALEEGNVALAKSELPRAMKKIDKAAKRRVIHPKQASRRIGRLSRRVAVFEKQAAADTPDAG